MDDEKFSYGKRKTGSFKKRSRNQFDNGKRKRRNPYPSDDPSSEAPKVTETVYRILCPVKKIGSVLGKGGEIVNALRGETRAKIRVADAIPGAEERVIIIFNYPIKQEEKIDAEQDRENDDSDGNENDNDNMRPHCPAQDALLKVHDRIVADEYFRGGVVHEKTDPDDAVTARILVPSNQVGCLIGKGGTVIQKLRNDYTGSSIRILPSEHLPPCAMNTDELVQISGAAAIVKKALYDISTRLHQHPRKENPPVDELIYASTQGLFRSGVSGPPPPSQGNPLWSHQQPDAYSTPPSWFGGHRNEPSAYALSSYNSNRIGNEGEAPEEFSMRVLCATGRIGGVIGKAGANVRQLEQQTRARIQVEDTSPEAQERIINVSSMEAPWDPVSPTIEAVLELQGRTSAISEDGTITTRLLVPSSKVGCLLGQGGNIITEMRRRTRADIRVYSKEDKPDYTSADEELVQISGNHNVAREALLEISSRLRARTFRSGNAAANPPPMFPDHAFGPESMPPGRRLPPSGTIGAAGNPPPVYPSGHAFAPPDNLSYRGPSDAYRGAPDAYRGASDAYRGAPDAYRGVSDAYKGAQDAYRGAVDAYRGAPDAYRGASDAYRGAPDAYRGAPDAYRGAPDAYRGAPDAYRGAPDAYRGAPDAYGGPPDAYRGPPPSGMTGGGNTVGGNTVGYEYPKGPGSTYETQGYPLGPPSAVPGYPNMTSSVEIKIPNSAVPSVLGVGGSNISDIRQISGARVKLQDPHSGASECVVEIHGSSEQMKAAQSLVQAFITSGGHNPHQAPLPSTMQVPLHRTY